MSTGTDLISLWSETVFDKPARARELRRLELLEPLPDMTIGLICGKIELMTTIAQRLIDLVREAGAEIGERRARGIAGHM
jgi:uncharacterized protein YlzI (FlbEa/FlbD family)